MRSIKILWLLLIFGIHPVFAATTSGVLKGDETWEGVVIVTGDVIVPEGVTLRIRPNALIRFNAGKDDQQGGYDINKCELIIEGILRAEGQDKYEIRFTSVNFNLPGQDTKSAAQPQAGDWYGIVFKKGNNDKSILTYSVVEFAYDGITCINASPRLFRNRIEGNYWNGILCDIMSAPKINSNQILNNGYAGLNCKIGSSPVISGNEITGNRYGVLVQDVSQPVIGDIRLGENAGKNAIYANLEFNLYNHTKNVIYAQRNDWGDNTNADKTIHDDDENKKFGLVVYTPVYRTGRISYSEFQSLASAAPAEALVPTEEDKKAKEKELEDLKQKLAEKKEKATKEIASGLDITSKEEKEKLAEEQAKENERLRLLEEQIKQQEQIKVEQAKALAEQKKNEELEKQKAAAAAKVSAEKPVESKTTTAASSFIPTKMANELDNNPKPIQKVNPIMPDLPKKAKVSGTVSLRVLVGVDGKPEEVYISKKIGNKDFDQIINDEAIAAIKKWVFEVGMSGGQPVKYWTVVTVLMK
jgi:colicin import membrane protein